MGLVAISGMLAATARAQDAANKEKADAGRQALDGLLLDYGVPASPAFELLPDKPSQVTHITTPKDIQARLSQWYDGAHINSGAAADGRPFAGLAGSLRSYQRNRLEQIAWRTVLSAGTVRKGASDVLAAIGLRVPVVDEGDPRAKPGYVDSLEGAYLAALDRMGPPPFDATPAQLRERADSASKATGRFRQDHLKAWWNALRVDVGSAVSVMARSGTTSRDSLRFDRAGLWVAASAPLGRAIAVTAAAKLSWANAPQDTIEAARHLVGASLRWFPAEWFAATVEGALNWSRYQADTLNNSWTHMAVGIEVRLPVVPGWFEFGYGGDAGRRGTRDPAFVLRYAIYQDRRMQK
jgi:hypothetical protein